MREELDAKQKRRIAIGIKIAHFPVVKTVEELDFKLQPSIEASSCASSPPATQADNVLVFGPPGVGKTHLAIALGRAAIETGHSVLFVTATALLASLSQARANSASSPSRSCSSSTSWDTYHSSARPRTSSFSSSPKRSERGSILLTTNQPVTEWGQVFGDETITAAILDRLLHHSHTLVIKGESYRLKNKTRAGLLGRDR